MFLKNLFLRFAGITVKAFAYILHMKNPHRRFLLKHRVKARQSTYEVTDLIPKIVWQTFFTDKSSLPVYINYLHNRKMAASYEFRLVSPEERSDYLAKHFPGRIYSAYMRLTDERMQSELWRFAVLCREGGAYIDPNMTLTNRLADRLKGKDHLFIASNSTAPLSSFIAAKTGNPTIATALEALVGEIENCKNEKELNSIDSSRVSKLAIEELCEEVNILPQAKVCLTDIFTNDHFLYMDRLEHIRSN